MKMSTVYFVPDNEFNREYNRRSIGKVFTSPPSYTVVQKLTKIEYTDGTVRYMQVQDTAMDELEKELQRTNDLHWGAWAHLKNVHWAYYKMMYENVTIEDVNKAQAEYNLARANYQLARRNAGLEYILTARDFELLGLQEEEK